jgi:hypothetical protein
MKTLQTKLYESWVPQSIMSERIIQIPVTVFRESEHSNLFQNVLYIGQRGYGKMLHCVDDPGVHTNSHKIVEEWVGIQTG